MLKSSLFFLFCETDAAFHQIATFILSFVSGPLIHVEHCSVIPVIRLLHFILVTAPKCCSSSSVGMLRKYLVFLFSHVYC